MRDEIGGWAQKSKIFKQAREFQRKILFCKNFDLT